MKRRIRVGLPVGLGLVALAASASAQIAPTTPNTPQGTQPSQSATNAPRLVQFVEATYPPEALAQGLEGAVLLQLSIDAEGHVTDVQVTEGIGNGFDEAAVTAARAFTFEPGRRDGVAVPSVLRYRYRFNAQRARQAQRPQVRAVLRGVIRSPGDRPVPNATVTLTVAGAPREQTTDATGAFRFELDAVGNVGVTVRAEGFEDFRATEAVANRDDLEFTYRLTARPVTQTPGTPAAPSPATEDDAVGEATIRARRPAREVTRRALEFREILRMPGTGGDALRAVQNFPGVARAINGLLIVRGTSPQDTQIFADGTLIPIVYHFGGLSSVISTELLDRIDFYPGNYSSRFGRAQGGIVDVGLRGPRARGWRAVANINLIDASVFVEGAITPKLSFAVSFRRSYIDAILGAVLSGVNAVTITSLPVYWDYQALLEYRPTSRDRLRLAVLGSDDSFAIVANRPPDNAPRFTGAFSSSIGFHTAQLLWDHTFNRDLSHRMVFSVGRNAINFGGGEIFGLDLAFWQINGRYELSYQMNRRARMNVGMDILAGPASTTFNGIRPPTEGQPFDPANAVRVATQTTDNVYRPGAYVEMELTPTSRLRLVPSVRADYTRDSNRGWTIAPRFSFRWEFLRSWFIKGGMGVFNQPPQFNQTSGAPNTFQPSTTVGNPYLIPQRSIHYGLGFEHDFSRYVTLSVEGFYKTLDEQVVSQAALQGPSYLNLGGGRIYGAEILFRHRPSERFFGWVAYTLSRSERTDSPTAAYRVFQFDQTHILTVIGSYRIGRGWEVGARFRLVSGNPTTPIVGSVFNGDTGTYTPLQGQAYSARVDPFHQLDIRVDKTWTFRRGSLNLYLEVLNVYNHANPEGVQYNYNYTQSQVVTGIPFFPNLGLRAEY